MDEENQKNEQNEPAAEQVDSELAGLPFPHSRVKDLLKSKQKEGVFIKKRAAIELNLWLGKMAEKVAEEIAKSDRAYVAAEDIWRITRRFDAVDIIEEEKKRLDAHLEAIKADVERLQSELKRV
ncbi:MAG: hypothetical protein JW727_02170 [Candidatus Aenigmarchaeota archaeon]|nr:hypothetical protein [Candidatus Aenigmarchaeota archaeon]